MTSSNRGQPEQSMQVVVNTEEVYAQALGRLAKVAMHISPRVPMEVGRPRATLG